jgi:hypothetical protein
LLSAPFALLFGCPASRVLSIDTNLLDGVLTMRRLCTGGLVAAAVVGVLGTVTMAGPPPKKQPLPATMTFRCMAGDPGSPSCDPVSDLTDRIRDDSFGTYFGGAIDTGGVFNVGFAPVTRVLQMFLGTRLDAGPRPCDTIGNCHLLDLADAGHTLDNFNVRVKPLTSFGSGSEDLAGGLYALTACGPGNVYPALVHYTFWLPDGDGHWGLNFNPKAYPGTTAANLRRLSSTQWTVESVGGTGDLLSWGHSGIRGKNGPSREGRFTVGFKLTINLMSSLPVGVQGCTSY